MLLADGFEIVEAFATHDVLRRGGIQMEYASTTGRLEAMSSSGVYIRANKLLEESDASSYDFLFLPGGQPGVDNLTSNRKVLEFVGKSHQLGKSIFAICAAPSILGRLGILDGKNYTCFPGYQVGNGNYLDQGIVIDGNLITGHSMGYSIELGKAIVEYYEGKEKLEAVNKGIYGLI